MERFTDGWPLIKAHFDATKAHPIVHEYHVAYKGGSDAVDEVKEIETVNTRAIHCK